MAKNTTKIEDKAVRAVGDYIDDCPKLKSYCQSNDKTPVWDGDIFIYKSEEEHNVKNIFARVPLQIKGTTNTEDGFYRIEREYIKAYQAERGCVFFMVQEDKETYKPIRILYAMLALEDVNALLQQKTQTIKIDLKEVPANPRDFETELIKFAKKRNREMIDNPAPKEIASLVKKFKEIEKHLDEVEDKGARIELKSFIDTIIGLKNDGTVGWRDTFVHLSRKALDLASKHIEGYDFLYLQHDLGLYLHEQKLYHLVEDYYVQSLKELRERATANPDAFLPDVAMTLNNLANLHSDLNRFEMAEKEFKEALEIYRELAKANPDAFLPDVATTLNNLAALHSDLNRFEMAEEEYKEALVIRRKLAEANPDAFLPDVATTLNNLAILHWNLNRFEMAEKEYKEALVIYRKLAEANPDAFLPNVATTLNNLANLHSNLNQFEMAEKEYKEALEIYRKLTEANPDAFLLYVAGTLNNLAALHSDLNRFEMAEEEYKEALGIYRKLANANPDAFLPYVATTLNNLAALHNDINRFEMAELEYKEALEIYRKLAKANPDAFLPNVGGTLFNIALLRMREHRKDEAKKACEEALEIYKTMAKKAPQKWNKNVDKAEQLLDFINETENS